jgi:flagellar capping protein FliD
MDVSSITQLGSSTATTGSTPVGGAGTRQIPAAPQGKVTPEAATLQRGAVRSDERIESTKVELSAFGQAKGALAELQTAAEAVTEPRQTATADDAKKAVENFVSAFNKANTAVSNAEKASAKETQALAGELRRSVSEGNGSAELRKAGIAQSRDGSLSLDTRALEKSLRESPEQTLAAVAETGRKVEKSATQQLANGGNASEAANVRDRRLEAEQGAQQAVVAASQRTIEQQSANITKLASGIAAYQRNFLG